MARKSRKHLQKNEEKSYFESTKTYRVAGYVRSSRYSAEADSIQNQISIISDFMNENPDFQLVDILEDNGFTGTNFARPNFQKLLDYARDGLIDCIVVKDFSRFAREHIGAGDYIEQIFPFLGIRFISISDNYDSINVLPEDMIIINFKHFANAYFAKETSRKTIQAKRNLQENGAFVGSFCAYGYKKNPDDKHKLIIDEEVSPIVKEVFDRYVGGEKKSKIISDLNERKVITPSQYKLEKTGAKFTRFSKKWSGTSIGNILQNPIYMGTLIQHRTEIAFYENIAFRSVPKDEQIKVENAVPAIISKEVWDKAQEIKRNNTHDYHFAPRADSGNIFKGVCFCKKCGYRLQISYRTKDSLMLCCPNCKNAKIKVSELTETVKFSLKTQIKIATDFEETLKKLPKDNKITANKRQITILEKKKINLFSDYADGIFSEEKYFELREEINVEIDTLQKAILKAQEKPQIVTLEKFKKFKGFRKLTEEIIRTFISKIVVSNENEIEIIYNFKDVLEKIENYIEKRKIA